VAKELRNHFADHPDPKSTLVLLCLGIRFSFMEEEALVSTVDPLPRRSIGESLDLEFVNVAFRALRSIEHQGKVCKAAIKEPAWLSKLQPSAPLDGYLLENDKFLASFRKDERITPGLKVTIVVSCS
jgi:hypothetical protein